MATTLFVLDAFRNDYICESNTPFLFECSKKGEYYKRVIPSFGFCERTEIFTGLKPKESGFFTAIGYDPENSPFNGLSFPKSLEKFESLIQNFGIKGIIPDGFLQAILRKIINNRLNSKKYRMNIYNIPFPLLHYWALTEDRIDHRDPEAFSVPSIFSLLLKHNKSFFYDSFTALNIPANGTDFDRIRLALDDMKRNNRHFYLVYISMPDYLGHKYGPNSIQLKKGLQQLDRELKKYYDEVLEISPKNNFIFLGDHGMATVKVYFNAEKEILSIAKKNSLDLKKDYIYFLDSTIVRLWYFSKKAKIVFNDWLKVSNKFNNLGIFITKRLAEKEHIPWNDRRYGDILWWANTGVLVYPDFFHRVEKYRGMHGYNPLKKQNQGTCIVYGHKIDKYYQDQISLSGIYSVLKKTLYL
tara:strand:+ start:120 stop:1358 length:1239 start_codon:yes stop_codon:yes gene_type:complete